MQLGLHTGFLEFTVPSCQLDKVDTQLLFVWYLQKILDKQNLDRFTKVYLIN
jgi:hypothetical protein